PEPRGTAPRGGSHRAGDRPGPECRGVLPAQAERRVYATDGVPVAQASWPDRQRTVARRTARQARMVADGPSPRAADEPPEAAGLGRPRLGPQSQDARARPLDSLGGPRRSEAAGKTAGREPTRCERLCQRTQDAEETAVSPLILDQRKARHRRRPGSIPLT